MESVFVVAKRLKNPRVCLLLRNTSTNKLTRLLTYKPLVNFNHLSHEVLLRLMVCDSYTSKIPVRGPHFYQMCERLYTLSRHGGRFVTVLPRSRLEDAEFRKWVQANHPEWEKVWDRPDPRRRGGPRDRWFVFVAPLPSREAVYGTPDKAG